MAWRWWGDPDGTPVLRIQGTPSSRLQYNPNPNVQREVGARYLMADRPGYGGSTRKQGRIMADPAWQKMSRNNIAETLKQCAEGWTYESFAMHQAWDFDPGDVKTSVTWWHGDDDMNAPLSAARRVVGQLAQVDLRVWHDEG